MTTDKPGFGDKKGRFVGQRSGLTAGEKRAEEVAARRDAMTPEARKIAALEQIADALVEVQKTLNRMEHAARTARLGAHR